MEEFDRVYAKIDLDRICGNLEAIRKNLRDGVKIIAIVKADGYGHGAVAVAKAVDKYVRGYGTASVDEALELRRHGIKKPILVLGVTQGSRYARIIEEEIRISVFDLCRARELSDMAVSMGKRAVVHIAVDTGMSRIGLAADRASAETAAKIAALPGIRVEGMFTHFARADEACKEPARRQLEKFQDFCRMVKEMGVEVPVCHCANSAASIELRDADMDAVRAGIAMYGLYPSDEVEKGLVSLAPAMELKSFVTYIKEIAPGTEVSYGGTFRAERTMKIATISVGYADGYPRSLSGSGQVLIGGRRVPVLGRICMDQMMADVTDVPGVREGDEVTLLGRDGNDEITMEELALKSGRFFYEIPCLIGKRVPRLYISQGRRAGIMTSPGGEYREIKE